MYKEIKINSLEEVFQLLNERSFEDNKKRYRSSCIYRGLSNSSYKLETSLHRNCYEKQTDLECSLLRNFSKYAVSEDPAIEDSVWRQLILGQHHGLPTRLLDWTYSPLIGLHFAVSEKNLSKMDDHNCAVWQVDIKELHSRLPDPYKKVLKENKAIIYTVKMLENVTDSLSQYDKDMSNESMLVVEPPSIDPRIINQYSYFSVVPHGILDIEDFLATKTNKTIKYVISKDIRWAIRDMLDQFNISERTVYPGLDGLSQMLARHYYVRR